MVVALDGAVVASEEFSNILLDLAVLRSLRIRVVLVFGAGYQVEKLAEKRGVEISDSTGISVTDDATLEVSLDAVSRMSNQVLQDLTAAKISAATANVVIGHRAGIIDGVDLLHTGQIEKIDTTTIDSFLNQEILPVIPPLCFDSSRHTYRVTSDVVARQVGVALGASKIVYVSADEPDFGIDTQAARQIPQGRAREMITDLEAIAPPSHFSKLKQAVRACRDGVPRVHLISARHESSILAELFSNEGIGTMIFADDYQTLRQAEMEDVDALASLIRGAVEEGRLVPREKPQIIERLADFRVLEIDNNIVGCVSAVRYLEREAIELACLYVKKSHEGLGYGRVLVEEIEHAARNEGIRHLFALTTQAGGYFVEKAGFRVEPNLEWMPESRLAYARENGRNAILLVKDLDSDTEN